MKEKKTQKKNTPLSGAIRRINDHVWRFIEKNTEDNVAALSGQSAFFMILSFVPFVLFTFSILSLFVSVPDTQVIDETVANERILPRIVTQLMQNAQTRAAGTISITVVMALWSAGKGMFIITDGISRIYRFPIKHIWVFRRVFAMGYTIVMFLFMMVSVGVMVLDMVFEHYISQAVGDIPATTAVLYAGRYIITVVIMAIVLTTALKLYLFRRIEDKRYCKYRVLLPGMIFTAVSWAVLSWGVSIYNRYYTSSIYGSLGAVVVLMMWIYFLMYLLLCGVQINYIYREQFYRFRFKNALKAIGTKHKKGK